MDINDAGGMTTAELKERVELIKKRQKAASSSTGTKALLVQTFTEDLPWLIKQVERVAELEAENARLQKLQDAAWHGSNFVPIELLHETERQLGAMREALTEIAAKQCNDWHTVGVGCGSPNRAKAALTPQPPAQENTR